MPISGFSIEREEMQICENIGTSYILYEDDPVVNEMAR